jgi:hypothetical protein
MRGAKTLVLVTMGLVLVGGCALPFQDARTGNQGGTSVLQATSKVATDRLDTLNPDDVQLLADLATEASGEELPEVSDEQAAAVVQFISDNSVVTSTDLQDLFARAESDPNSIVISEEVRGVLIQLGADYGESDAIGEFLG